MALKTCASCSVYPYNMRPKFHHYDEGLRRCVRTGAPMSLTYSFTPEDFMGLCARMCATVHGSNISSRGVAIGGSCLSVRALKGPQMTVRVCLNFEVNFCQRRVKTEASPSEVTRFRVSELLVACLRSYLDLILQLLGYHRGASPPWSTPGAPGGEGLDSCKDGESSC